MNTENLGINRWAQLAKNFLGSDFFNDLLEPDNNNLKDQGQTSGSEDQGAYLYDVYQVSSSQENKIIIMVNIPGMKDINSVKWQVVDNNKLQISGTCPQIYDQYEALVSQRKKGDFNQEIVLDDVQISSKHTYSRYYRGILELHFARI